MLGARRFRLIIAAAVAALAVGGAGTVWQAQAGFVAAPAQGPAATGQWSGTVLLRNDGGNPATVVLNFYHTNGVLAKSYTLPTPIPPKGVLSVDTEAIPELPAGFSGSAVVSSNQPVTATWVGFDATNPAVNRTLYTGFSDGAATVFVPSISNGYNDQTSTLAVQSIDNTQATVTVRFFERFSGVQTAQFTDTIAANASHYYDTSNLPGGQQLPAPWTGSAIIESGSSRLAAAGHQPRLNGAGASTYEGVAAVSTSAYFPSLQYQNGERRTTSFISIQNATNTGSQADVTFFNASGTPAGSTRITLGPYQKQVVTPGSGGANAGWTGTAVVKATAAIAAVVNANGGDLSSGYAGAGAGATKVSMPYVRWATSGDPKGLRTTIDVMNADQQTGDITVRFYDQNGLLVQAPSFRNVAPLARVTVDASAFAGDTGFTGTAEAESTAKLVAAVSIVSVDGAQAESAPGNIIP